MAFARPSSLVLAAVAAVLSGCGSDTTPTTSSRPASKPAATRTTTTAAEAKGGAERVAIKDFDYAPGKLDVAVGTKVTWRNADAANHTVTFDSGSMKSLGNQAKGASKSMTFTKAGTFPYHCDYHPNMHGTVVVR